MPRAAAGKKAAAATLSAPLLSGGTVELDASAVGREFNMPIVHESVRAELAARRRGTASTKTRGQVSGGSAQPWRQKGTGRARAGSSRSPIWTGGGIVFGPSPRSYTFQVNRKARRAALGSALSVHASRESLAVFDAGAFTAPSTRQARQLLREWDGAGASTLVVLGADEASAGKSFRNLEQVVVLPVEDVGVANVIGAARLLISQAALPALVARASGAGPEEVQA
jgi:large subunit ribosomal protein L4